MINYDGKLHVAIPHFQCIESVVRATLVGDIGETGVVLLDLNSTTEKGGKRVGVTSLFGCLCNFRSSVLKLKQLASVK